ncbi:MAG TPA: hypothetical protein VHG89_05985 [Verrucomicrobiae bacterium]|nr:hypothetical protein [Verrucomicrobiae bacterium]
MLELFVPNQSKDRPISSALLNFIWKYRSHSLPPFSKNAYNELKGKIYESISFRNESLAAPVVERPIAQKE